VLCAEAAQIDDPAHAALSCGGCEVFRAATIGVREQPRRAHRMNEVVRGRDTRESLMQRAGLKDVSANDFRLRSGPSRQRLGPAHHAAHQSPRRLEPPQQPAANVAVRPRKQDAPGCLPHRHRYPVVGDPHTSPLPCLLDVRLDPPLMLRSVALRLPDVAAAVDTSSGADHLSSLGSPRRWRRSGHPRRAPDRETALPLDTPPGTATCSCRESAATLTRSSAAEAGSTEVSA
jgi:hypothetical protein